MEHCEEPKPAGSSQLAFLLKHLTPVKQPFSVKSGKRERGFLLEYGITSMLPEFKKRGGKEYEKHEKST